MAALVADLVEPARVQTFEQLGDGRRAFTLAVRWVRPKLLADGTMVVVSGFIDPRWKVEFEADAIVAE